MKPMTQAQRKKCVEILSYIKRQNGLRKQRVEFQQQLRITQMQKEELEAKKELGEFSSSETEESHEMTTFEKILNHLETSSLFIFPMNSRIRLWCQQCVAVEEEEVVKKDDTKETANQSQASPSKSQVMSPNKVGAISAEPLKPTKPASEDKIASRSHKDL